MRSCNFCAYVLKACKKGRAVVEEAMKFYIITPTYNSLKWLRCCLRSVADQVGGGVEVHHHVQDGGSKDGTSEWLEAWKKEHSGSPGYTFTYESCSDEGMYDALNKAWDKLPEEAEVTAHLNSDEQYLPQALQRVAGELMKNPKADILLSSYIVINADGSYHCHRRVIKRPHEWISRGVCEMLTCCCFHRADAFRKHGVRFDVSYKSIGDLVFFSNVMKTHPRVHVCPRMMTSAYTMTGSNLAWTNITQLERKRYFSTYSKLCVTTYRFISRMINFIRYRVEIFFSPPRELSVYRLDDEVRTTQKIEHPTTRWRIIKN